MISWQLKILTWLEHSKKVLGTQEGVNCINATSLSRGCTKETPFNSAPDTSTHMVSRPRRFSLNGIDATFRSSVCVRGENTFLVLNRCNN